MKQSQVQPVTARCPHCHGQMQLLRHITLADMPDLYVFYCSRCQCAETIKQKPSSAIIEASGARREMPALDQKPTSTPIWTMSALPPKADIRQFVC